MNENRLLHRIDLLEREVARRPSAPPEPPPWTDYATADEIAECEALLEGRSIGDLSIPELERVHEITSTARQRGEAT